VEVEAVESQVVEEEHLDQTDGLKEVAVGKFRLQKEQ